MTDTNWPLVDPNDDGIRPAGGVNRCFYCRQLVGHPHGRECVVVTKRVELRVRVTLPDADDTVVTGLWQLDEPHCWEVSTSEYSKNDGSWCANNFMHERGKGSVVWDGTADPWPALEALRGDENGPCLCGGVLRFEFVRVVDATPRRELAPKDRRFAELDPNRLLN